jgi:hypothetical protein
MYVKICEMVNKYCVVSQLLCKKEEYSVTA